MGVVEQSQSVMQELRATLWRRVGDATIVRVDDLADVLVHLATYPADDALVERGIRLAHEVAGSAGVYGFRAEARAASELEGLLRDWDAPTMLARARELVALLDAGFEVEA